MPIPRSVALSKRLIDLAGGSVLAAVALPLVPAIALAILLDDGGPVLFVQRRARRLRSEQDGAAGVDEFAMLKFRTMRLDAERGRGATLATEGDPRVTRVGRVLRRTRLDELPQLLNVLAGDMSLVGPRPERAELLAQLAQAIPFFEERMRDTKPGLTGLAQVTLGYTGRPHPGSPAADHAAAIVDPYGLPETAGNLADDMRMKLLFDLAYAGALESLGSYLRMETAILAKTPWTMLRGLGR
jgi:lipopolysaccharide/colanic/teichoic acid biosynthesis glycosyltransferase